MNGPLKSALEGHGLIKAVGQDADESVSGSGRINGLDRLGFDTLAVPVRVKGKRPERARGDDAKAAFAGQIGPSIPEIVVLAAKERCRRNRLVLVDNENVRGVEKIREIAGRQ